MTMAPECAVAKMAQAGKYLSFKLDNEEYGLEILKVQEIVGTAGISPLPRPSEHARGYIRLRGREVPVFSLRELFGLEQVQETEKNCVIIAEVPVQGSPTTIGLIVDEVCEVLNIASEEIHFPPSWAGGMEEPDFINGMGQLGNRDVILLEIENFFSEEELKAVAVFDD
jgi:purine-binding chemotaxis protein CheW